MNRSLELSLLTTHAAVTGETVNTLSCAAALYRLTVSTNTTGARCGGTISTGAAPESYKT